MYSTLRIQSAAVVAVLFVSGCVSISYKPSVSLQVSPEVIHSTVQIEKFEDLRPESDRKRKVGGTSATEPDALAGDLSTEVTDAILLDFKNNQVFESVKKRFDDGPPDLIMRGKIHRFYGKAGSNFLTFVTFPVYPIWLLGVPIYKDDGLVELEITFERTDGVGVATYRETTHFKKWYTLYNNPMAGVGVRLNRSFSDCVSAIRKKMLADASALSKK